MMKGVEKLIRILMAVFIFLDCLLIGLLAYWWDGIHSV